MIELAFFRGFLAWEHFLEDCFILYLMGKTPPRGRPPYRYATPPNAKHAYDLVSEGREYANWDAAAVVGRARRFFRDGRPFTTALQANQNLLGDTRTIRNAVAHESAAARTKFENLVRRELGFLPPSTSIGGFLNTTKPRSTPPVSYLEHYLKDLESMAGRIVPS